MPLSREIVKEVLSKRQEEDHKLKDFSKKYAKLKTPKSKYIFVPQISSGKRR